MQQGSSKPEGKPVPSEDPTEQTAMSIVEDLEDPYPRHDDDDDDCPIGEIIIELEDVDYYQSGGQHEHEHVTITRDGKNHKIFPSETPTTEETPEKVHVGVLWFFILLFLCSIYGFIWVMFNLGSKQPNS